MTFLEMRKQGLTGEEKKAAINKEMEDLKPIIALKQEGNLITATASNALYTEVKTMLLTSEEIVKQSGAGSY